MAAVNIPKSVSLFILLLTWRPSDVDGTRISTNLLDLKLPKEQARKACEGSNMTSSSRLPTYEGTTEQSAVSGTMTDNNVRQAWLAVQKESFPIWMWVDNQPVGKDLASQKWPDHMNCGVLHLRDATLEMDDCSIALGYLCQIPRGTCADRGISHVECVDMKPHSYVYHCSVSNWYAARQKCQDDGLELAVIRSEEAMANLTRVWYRNNRRPCVKLWVGLRHHEWRYTGKIGSTAPGIHWASGEPSQAGKCAVVYKAVKIFLWKAVPCISKQNTICVINTTDPFIDRTGGPPGRVSTVKTISPPGFGPQVITTAGTINPHGPEKNRDPGTNGVAVGLTIFFVVLVAVIAVAILCIYLRRKKSGKVTLNATGNGVERNEPSTDIPLLPKANSNECDSSSVSPGNKLGTEEQQMLEEFAKSGKYHTVGRSGIKPHPLDLQGDENEATKTFDSSGGELRLSGSNIVLKVPKEAVAEGEEVSICMKKETDLAKYLNHVKHGDIIVVPVIIITMKNALSKKAVLEIPFVQFDQQELTIQYKGNAIWHRVLSMTDRSVIFNADEEKININLEDTKTFLIICKEPENPVSRWQALAYANYYVKEGLQEVELRVYIFDVAHTQNDIFKNFEKRQKGYRVRKEGMSIYPSFKPSSSDTLKCGVKLESEDWNFDDDGSVQRKTLADITDKQRRGEAELFQFVLQATTDAEDSVRIEIEFEIEPISYEKKERETPECALEPTRYKIRIHADDITQHQDVMNTSTER